VMLTHDGQEVQVDGFRLRDTPDEIHVLTPKQPLGKA
jgi:hypothetical protein